MAAIEALPLVQTPEVFGLHANADISYYTSATKALWRNLVCCMHMYCSATPCLCLMNSIMPLKSCCHPFEHAEVGLNADEQQRAKRHVNADNVSTPFPMHSSRHVYVRLSIAGLNRVILAGGSAATCGNL